MKDQIKESLKEYNKDWGQWIEAREQLTNACKKEYGNDCKVEVIDKELYIDGELTK